VFFTSWLSKVQLSSTILFNYDFLKIFKKSRTITKEGLNDTTRQVKKQQEDPNNTRREVKE
jgi:hypothetical protein